MGEIEQKDDSPKKVLLEEVSASGPRPAVAVIRHGSRPVQSVHFITSSLPSTRDVRSADYYSCTTTSSTQAISHESLATPRIDQLLSNQNSRRARAAWLSRSTLVRHGCLRRVLFWVLLYAFVPSTFTDVTDSALSVQLGDRAPHVPGLVYLLPVCYFQGQDVLVSRHQHRDVSSKQHGRIRGDV